MVKLHRKSILLDKSIPIEPLMVLDEIVNSVLIRDLNDNGCNLNMLSSRVVKENRQNFKLVEVNWVVLHNIKDLTEPWSEIA